MAARSPSGIPRGPGRRAPAASRGMASAPLACLVSGLTADDREDDAALAVLARLRAHLAPLGGTVAAMTPLTRDGQPRPGGGWHSPRVARLTAGASFPAPQHAACPFVLPDGAPREGPGAATVAASPAGPGLRAQPVREAFQVLATWADAVVVAGIGGWLTPPVAPGAPATGPLLATMCQRLHLPLLLCTRLDADAPERARRAMKLAGLRPVAWVAMLAGPSASPAETASLAVLEGIFHAPCVGQLTTGAEPAANDGQGIALDTLLACVLAPAAGSPPRAAGSSSASSASSTSGAAGTPGAPSQITQDAAARRGR